MIMIVLNDPLQVELIKLARKLEPHGIKLIVGGGYGLLLKTEQLRLSQERTRIDPIPVARSTDDLDFFLHAEIISSIEKCETIRGILDKDYIPIEGAAFYQFVQKDTPLASVQPIKVDLLASPPQPEELRNLTSSKSRRIRPKGRKGILHARLTEEAVFVEEYAIPIDLMDDGGSVQVFVPHPFAYLFLKLNALNDRIGDLLKGPYHAFDTYRIIAMMTEKEWGESVEFVKLVADHKQFKKAAEIVSRLFADENSEGVRLARRFAREQEYDDPDIAKLLEDLHFLFLGNNE